MNVLMFTNILTLHAILDSMMEKRLDKINLCGISMISSTITNTGMHPIYVYNSIKIRYDKYNGKLFRVSTQSSEKYSKT